MKLHTGSIPGSSWQPRGRHPGFRKLWLKAVLAGGEVNHEQSLPDEILLLRNHLVFARSRSLGEVVKSTKARVGYKRVGVEVESLEEAIEAVEAGADYIQFGLTDPPSPLAAAHRVHSGGPQLNHITERLTSFV